MKDLKNKLNASVKIEVGVEYEIQLINYDDGRFVFTLNNVVVSDVEYQTKSFTENHVIQWGQYWSKGYNIENDPLNRIVIRIDDFKLLIN